MSFTTLFLHSISTFLSFFFLIQNVILFRHKFYAYRIKEYERELLLWGMCALKCVYEKLEGNKGRKSSALAFQVIFYYSQNLHKNFTLFHLNLICFYVCTFAAVVVTDYLTVFITYKLQYFTDCWHCLYF